MTRHQGTEQVEPGLYVNLRQLAFKPLSESGPLPGSQTDVYYRVPIVVMLLAAPLMGLAYVVFLPFIGFAMVAYLLGGKGLQLAGGAAREAARVLRPAWEPSLAFLSRSKPAKPTEPRGLASNVQAETTDEWAESVERKLNETDHRG